MSAREFGVMLVMCLTWGFHFVVMKTAVSEIPPIFYAAIRMTLVAAIMSPFLRWRSGHMARVLAAGLCLGSINYALIFSGVKFATASAASIAIELYVPFATIMSVLFLGDHVGWRRVVGVALAFAGVIVIVLGKGEAGEAGARLGLGVGLVAAAAFTESVGAIFVKKSTAFKPQQLLAWFGVIGAVSLWLMTFLFESGQGEAFAAADKPRVIGAILYSAVVASVIGHTAYYWLLHRLPVSLVAPSALMTTLFAVVFSVILLGDPFGPQMAIGGAMTLTGIGFVLLRSATKQANTAVMTEPPG